MIPKTIATAWFGRGQKCDLFKRCQETWHEMHPHWQFIEITEDNCGCLMDMPFMQAVHDRKEFVKCTELARLWAVERHGGIYMDLDIEILKPLDPLLEYEHFFVREPGGLVNGAIFGAVSNCPVVQSLIDAFPSAGDGVGSPVDFGPAFLTSAMPKDGNVLPPHVAFPYGYNEPDPGIYGSETIVVHRWAGSWSPELRRQNV